MDTPEKKTSVLFYTEWARPLRSLPLEDVGQLFCAILDYTETGATPQLSSPVAAMAWEFIRPRLDANMEKWDATREKRRQAGRRGALVTNGKERQTAANPANAAFAETEAANPAVTVPVSVPENVPVSVPVPVPVGACAPDGERETTQLEQVWMDCGYDGAARAAGVLARYREKGLEEGLILEAVRQAAAHGADSPLAYAGRILDQAAAAGQTTLAVWQAAHRGKDGGKRVNRPSPSGQDFLADAAQRPRRHKRKG